MSTYLILDCPTVNNSMSSSNPYKNKRNPAIRRVIEAVLTIPFLIAVYYFYKLSNNKIPLTALDLGLKPTISTVITEDYDFHLAWHPKSRYKRFVSAEERVSEIL